MRKSTEQIVEKIKEFIVAAELKQDYRRAPTDFTRERKLTFQLLIVFMLRKLYKSLALEIGEFFGQIGLPGATLSKSAFTQARQKLKPLFFADLLSVFNNEFYTDNQDRVSKLKGMRILAVDGSTLDLPFSPELEAYYGSQSNQHQQTRYVKGRVSIAYDLLNNMVVHGVLQPYAKGEMVAAIEHLAYCQPKDLLIYDRGYACYQLVDEHRIRGLEVVVRLKVNSSKEVEEFAASPATDVELIIKPGRDQKKKHGYSEQAAQQVRLIKLKLENGEQVLLLTTLLDKEQYPAAFLLELYRMRWGVETRYDVLKNVLQVEYFSGLKKEAIEQDFYICLFLMNMQALLAEELKEEIAQKYAGRKYKYQVNLSVAVGFLKSKVVDLFLTKNTSQILAHLKQSFLQHVEPIRPGRKFPRQKDKYRNRKEPILMKNRKNVL